MYRGGNSGPSKRKTLKRYMHLVMAKKNLSGQRNPRALTARQVLSVSKRALPLSPSRRSHSSVFALFCSPVRRPASSTSTSWSSAPRAHRPPRARSSRVSPVLVRSFARSGTSGSSGPRPTTRRSDLRARIGPRWRGGRRPFRTSRGGCKPRTSSRGKVGREGKNSMVAFSRPGGACAACPWERSLSLRSTEEGRA